MPRRFAASPERPAVQRRSVAPSSRNQGAHPCHRSRMPIVSTSASAPRSRTRSPRRSASGSSPSASSSVGSRCPSGIGRERDRADRRIRPLALPLARQTAARFPTPTATATYRATAAEVTAVHRRWITPSAATRPSSRTVGTGQGDAVAPRRRVVPPANVPIRRREQPHAGRPDFDHVDGIAEPDQPPANIRQERRVNGCGCRCDGFHFRRGQGSRPCARARLKRSRAARRARSRTHSPPLPAY